MNRGSAVLATEALVQDHLIELADRAGKRTTPYKEELALINSLVAHLRHKPWKIMQLAFW